MEHIPFVAATAFKFLSCRIRVGLLRTTSVGSILSRLALSLCMAVPGAVHASGTIVPAYFRPTWTPNYWEMLASTASKVQTTAILNPSSGPGATKDQAYADAAAKLRMAGGNVIGYVDTAYATRDKMAVLSDIAKYKEWYGVGGVFFDQMTDDVENVTYYANLYNYIKATYANFHVVGNAGKNTVEQYISLPAVDTVVVFEGSYKSFTQYAPREWMRNRDKKHFAYLVYEAPRAQQTCILCPTSESMIAVADNAIKNSIGYVYVTDDSGSNPWDTLPYYWSQEAEKLGASPPPCGMRRSKYYSCVW
jgi:hypothetical protein